MKYALCLFAGAAAVTSAIVATGASAAALVAIGGALATVTYTLVAWALGARRIASIAARVAGRRRNFGEQRHSSRKNNNLRPIDRPAKFRPSPIEADVIAALVAMGARPAEAERFTAAAARKSPQRFDAMFRAAVAERRAAA